MGGDVTVLKYDLIQCGPTRRFALMAMFFALLIAVFPAQAIMRKVAPGEMPKLDADEGLLLIAVDSNIDLQSLRISREGMNLDVRNMRDLNKGRNSQLYVVPAGRYRWSRLNTDINYYRLGDDAEYAFEVKAGVINYPGDLIYRRYGWFSSKTQISNRGLAAMDWLDKEHPSLFRVQRFEFTGHYPDPFPAMYREAIAKAPLLQQTNSPVPPSGALPISIDKLWRPGELQLIALSPGGELVAEVVTAKKAAEKDKDGKAAEDHWVWKINLIDLGTGKVVRLYDSPKKVSRLDWVDQRTLAMSMGNDNEPDAVVVVNILDTATGRTYEKAIMPRVGVIVRVLPNEPGNVLFASAGYPGIQVHRVDLRSQAAIKRTGFYASERLNKSIDNAFWWMADASGRLRLAFATNKAGERVLMHGLGKEFRQVLNVDDDAHFRPLALSPDGERIYGLSDQDRDQRDLVEFDPTTGKIIRTLFSLHGTDVEDVRLDHAGNLIGASYFQDGLLISDYFDADGATINRSLRAAFPEKSVSILERDRDSRHIIAAVSGSDQPVNVFHYDRHQKRAELISETRPWLLEQKFSPAYTIRTKSKDGLDIEAYLTLPAGEEKRPLIVFSHGGPIGVRDNRSFDPEVQFIASLGYAVLQVNFRGSEGFGTAFRKAGERNYGAAIEDDVDAALSAALASYPLDAARMCALGSSYGGYSAMVSAIRWPGRFRCVVSISGISDLALFFTASDSAGSEESRKLMEKIIGDPRTSMDEMLRYSPLYHYRELTVPVMLIHGTEDLRVDYEHTRRLQRMLNLAGRPAVLIELEGEGHGIRKDENNRKAWESIAGFLRKNIGTGSGDASASVVQH